MGYSVTGYMQKVMVMVITTSTINTHRMPKSISPDPSEFSSKE
jgi:hypothetical protein